VYVSIRRELAQAICQLAEKATLQPGSASLPVADHLVNGKFTVSVDKSTFVSTFENALLKLEKLTPHQKAELGKTSPHASLHIRAPAGAGKTFVGLHIVTELLKGNSAVRVLFAARNKALCIFFMRWLLQRFDGWRAKGRALDAMWFLCGSFKRPFRLGVNADRSTIVEREEESQEDGERDGQRAAFALVVVDEAHHIYADPQLAAKVSFCSPQSYAPSP